MSHIFDNQRHRNSGAFVFFLKRRKGFVTIILKEIRITNLRAVDLSGKTIIPFCTHGGGGFGRMIEDYKNECENSIVGEGIALKGDYSFDELQN